MKKALNTPSLVLTALLSVILQYLMSAQKIDLTDRVIGGILFFVLNYFILTLVLRGLFRILKVLQLPAVRLRSYAYYLYPVAMLILYAAFLIVMARLANYRLPSYLVAGVIIAGVAAAILAQLGGAFPDRLITQKKRAFRLESTGGMLGGFDFLGTLTGQYRDGIVVGTDAIPFDHLEKMHRSKDSIIVEGSQDPKLELIIVSDKSQNYFIDLLAERLKTSRSVLVSSQADKKPAPRKKPDDKAKDLKRAKPVKLIKATEEARRQTQAKAGSAQGKPQ